MTQQVVSGLNPLSYVGVRAPNPPNVILATRVPTSNDTGYDIGTFWVDETSQASYELCGYTSGVPSWVLLGGSSSDVNTLTASSGGAISPTGGNINLLGTANQITTAGAGSTITFSLPAAITTPGSLQTTTTLTGGTGITATTGNIVATAGQVNAGTTMTAGTGITATTGNIVATVGQVNAGTTMTAGTGITSTTGDIVATAGAVSAGTTVTGGTGVTATTGNFVASAGSIQVTAPSVAGASPVVNNVRTGQTSFSDVIANGAVATLTMTNSVISAASIILASASCTTANSAVQIAEITPGVGTVDFRIFNAGSASTAANINVNFWVLN